MRLTRSSFLTLLASLPVAYATIGYNDDLLEPQHYRVDPYIRAAVALQSLDHAAAITRLHDMAQHRHSPLSVIILCRMLFRRRRGSDYAFRAPAIGVPAFIRGTEDDWPLWPIEPVEGVPFTVVWGYTIGGLPESDESYLNYCEANCDWTDVKYSLKTIQQKQDALAKLMSSDKWKQTVVAQMPEGPINFNEFLFRQIK
jgi:hypothetical protein